MDASVKWTRYPTRKDRENGENGVTMTGDVWSAGPGGQWVIPTGKTHPVLVKRRPGSMNDYYEIESEQSA
jgi:hypothetical protein